jgi:hypothetical protein
LWVRFPKEICFVENEASIGELPWPTYVCDTGMFAVELSRTLVRISIERDSTYVPVQKLCRRSTELNPRE